MNRQTLQTLGFLVTALAGRYAHAGGGPLFVEVEQPFGQQPCPGQERGCWTNYLRVHDLDGDGDLDILMVNYEGFFEPNQTPQPLVLYRNDGNGGFTDISTAALGDHVGGHRQVAIGDANGDGQPDIYAPEGQGQRDTFFINNGMSFTNEADERLPDLRSQAGATRFFDADNDGDLDLFVADGYALQDNTDSYGHLYLNNGTGMFEESPDALPNTFVGIDIDDVDVLDADRDFDLDLLVNGHDNGRELWLNDGTGQFTTSQAIPQPVPSNFFQYNPAPCDVDGDGDLDLIIDNAGADGGEQLLINDGSGSFTDQSGQITGNPAADDNGVLCADIDNDGDFDGVVLSLSNTGERLLTNDGNGSFTLSSGAFPVFQDGTLWGEFGDLNGDGRLDLVTGQGELSYANRVFLATDAVPVDDRPPVIITTEEPAQPAADAPVVIRYAVSDRTITDAGPRLSRAYAVIDPGGETAEVEALFVGGDLFRAVLPGAAEGTRVEYQLCATDRQGNTACTDTLAYEVGEVNNGDTGDGTESGTSGGDNVDGGSDSASDPSAGGTAADSGPETSQTDTTDGPTGSDGNEGGCGCRSSSPDRSAIGLLILFGVGAWSRRRACPRPAVEPKETTPRTV